MKTTSIAEAQSHLPELIDAARQRRRRTVILRDGKPVAAIVPLGGDAAPPFDDDAIGALFAGLGGAAPDRSAVAELISERR